VLVACAMPHSGRVEIAMPAVGIAMIVHGAITLIALRPSSQTGTA
jgi:hypothetical protein